LSSDSMSAWWPTKVIWAAWMQVPHAIAIAADRGLPVDDDRDGDVDLDDVMRLVNRWNLEDGECVDSFCYEAIYDLNNDGKISLADIMMVVSNWGLCS